MNSHITPHLLNIYFFNLLVIFATRFGVPLIKRISDVVVVPSLNYV